MSLHGSHRLARAGAVVVIGLVVLAAPCFADWWQAAGPLPDGYATVSGAHEFQNEGVDEGGDCDWECAQSMWTSWRITEHNADVMYRNNGYYWTVQGDGGSGQVEVDSSALGVACSPGVVPTGTAPGTGTYGADGYVWVYCKAPEPFEEQCQPPARKRKIWVLDVNLETPWGGGPGNNIEGLHNGDGSDIDREGYDASSYNHPVRINHNRDDDDENGTPDVEQSGPVPGEDDLIPVQIQVTEGIRQHQQGTVKLTVSGWEDCQGGVFPDLKLWRDASKASQIVLTDGLSKTYSCAAFLSEVIDGSGGWVYVECCVPAGSWYPDMRVFLSVAYQTNSQMDDPEDTIAFDPFWADLRIDSDNTNNFGSPDNSDHEEEIEDIAGDPAYPGKLVPTNDNDNDADGIPDYADGFDLDGEEGTDDDRTGGEQFVPMFLGLGHPMNYSQTRITFVYDASDPSGVTAESGQYTLPSGGALRLWTKPGDAERNKNSVEAGGDFVPAGVPVAASHFQSAGMGLALYVEGVRTSQSAADRRIIAIVEPDGPDAISIPQSDAVRVTVVRLDADVDSDNTNGFDAPDRSDDEDAIEDIAGDPDYPGKVLTVNDDDDDHDGVPDYADGFDLDGQADTPDDLNESEHFTPLVIELSPGFDPTTAQLWIDYSDSDPAGVTHQGTPAVYSLPTGGGLLRLWTKDGSQARNKAAVGGGGDFVPKLTWVDVADLNPSGNTITLYAEGVYACSSLAAPARIRVEADPDGDGPAWFVHGDAVRLSVLGADLDIDSDNNNGTANPDHNAYEDQIEDIADDPDYPGKYLDVNGNDDDNDGVPDFADGFDLDGQQGNADDANANEYFARVVLCLPDPIDRDIATVRLTYDASDPAAVVAAGDPVTYTLPTSGKLRLWTKNGYESRNKNSVSDPQSPGDYVPPGDHDATALGFSTYGGLVTFYVEGTQASHAIADQRLLVEIDPDGLVGPLSFVPHDAVRITVLGVDLDIDSDNDNALDAPDRSAYEDQIEDTANNPAYPGKVLEPNDNDDDSDGIPDFADGFNFDGQAGNADDQNASEDFAQLVLEVPAPISLTNATVTITYDASDPAAVTYDTQTQTYTPGDGALRLWTQDGSVARNKATLLQGGHYVPPKTYDASDLGLSGESRTITLYVEAIRPSTATADQRILVEVDSDGTGGTSGSISPDAVRITVGYGDLDIDSDNDNGFAAPDRDAAEDLNEDTVGDPAHPGKYVFVNDNDDDGDGIPDFADGFNFDGQAGNADDQNASEDFVQLVLELPEDLDVSVARVRFTYDASDPVAVAYNAEQDAYAPGTGSARLWMQDGNAARNGGSILDGGDFVPDGTAIEAAALGFTPTQRVVTLYAEGVSMSPEVAGLRVRAEIDPDGEGGAGFVFADAVRVTVLGVDLDIDSDNDSDHDVPERDPAEERWEDVPSDDEHPGKIILVGNADSDADSLPDFADGFDYMPGVAADNLSEGTKFVPLVLEIGALAGLSEAEIEFSYAASDPDALEATLDHPYPLPDGSLRIWRKDGSVQRDKRGVQSGGDFVASGVRYPPTALGFQDGRVTLYVEAVRESQQTADSSILVSAYPNGQGGGLCCQDRVRLTASRMELLLNTVCLGEPIETSVLCVTKLPEPDESGRTYGTGRGAVAAYTIRIHDPREGFTVARVGDQDVAIERVGGVYTNPTLFLCILPEDQDIVDADKQYQLRLDEVVAQRYSASVLPDAEDADPASWTVTQEGQPQVSVADGVLTVNTVDVEAAYAARITNGALWQTGKYTVVEVRFKIVGHGAQGQDGALRISVGDQADHWEIGIRPDRFVHYQGGNRAEIPFPPAIGDNGSLLDGQFHLFRFVRAAGAGQAAISVDYEATHTSNTVGGAGSGASWIEWGDPGEQVRGHVQYDFVRWWHATPGEVIYTTSPSQLIDGRDIIHLATDELEFSYNPGSKVTRHVPDPELPSDRVVGELVQEVVGEMEAEGWAPANPNDPGAFGKEVHRRTSVKLHGKKGWVADVYVETNTRKVLSIGDPPEGVPSRTYTQVDAIALDGDYTFKAGDILDPDAIEVYEIKTSLKGSVDQRQHLKLKRISGGKGVRLTRSKKVYESGAYKLNRRVKNITLVLDMLSLADTAYAFVEMDKYQNEWDELERLMRNVRDAETPNEKNLYGIEAAEAMARYLSHFTPDSLGKNCMRLMMERRLMSQWDTSD